MYKVLIVDDEPVILEGLQKIISWQDYDCQVVATAKDGLEAEKKVEEYKPHIMFTDIRMPNKDGLTLIAALRSTYPNMQITVLTAYRDFEYAQKAIKLGVSRYLLKPSKMSELIEAIEFMVKKLDRLQKQSSKPKKIESIKEDEDTAGSFIVSEALKYMEENYNTKLTLDEIAKQVYVSKWHLSRLLSEHTKQSFFDNLNTIRIDKAKELLKDPSLRITDVADLVGFSDASHFAKLFKKHAGMSGNEYRNSITETS